MSSDQIYQTDKWAKKLGFSPELSQEEFDAALAGTSAPISDIHPTEGSFNATEVATMARESLDFLAALAMPTIFKYFFPPVFLSVWNWLLEYVHKTRDFSQLALGLPRGFGKTMVVKLFILYCILFTRKQFILVLCETTSKAKNIIADVMDMLDEPNIKRTFGDWNLGKETDTQELKKFGFRGRNIILMGAGVESGIRGITIKNRRPDVMIFDDIQSKACANSQTQSETLEGEMYGTAMKAKSPEGCLFIFIANMYPTKWSILRKLKSNPNWIKFIAGGILADGSSLWEELQPIEQLLKEFQNDLDSGHPEIFYAEVLNDETASANALIDFSKLQPYPFQDTDIAGGNFIIIDPATDKPGSDAVSIGYFEVHDGYPCLIELEEGCLSPGDTIRTALKMAFSHNCRAIGVESNAYQYSLLYWFNFICLQLGIVGIEALELYSGSTSKNSRIISMIRSYAAGEIWVHPRCKTATHLQMMQFNPIKRDNTDGLLDLLTYAPKMIELYGEFIQINTVIQEQDWQASKVLEFNSCI